ncbi:MAG: energy transducer TonB [Blastocatellales bacterium]
MFDKLVESAKQKQGKRARRLFLATGVIYVVALTALGVMTIVGFSPALAEEYDVLSKLIPPPPPPGRDPQPPPAQPNLNPIPRQGFVEPKKIVDILPPNEWKKLNLEPRQPDWFVDGGPGVAGIGRRDGVPGVSTTRETPPPPPTPTPAPAVKPAATPAQDQIVRLTSVLTQGRALRKVQPPYPAIARQARVQGSVQIQISISETGEVTEATLLSGHPLLRDAALQAARQWLFRPTELNGRPVRAVGVITFNFTLY